MEVQFPSIIFYFVNITILIVVLNKLLYKPVRSVLAQRAEKIEQGQKAAEANIKKQASADKEAEETVKEAQKQASQTLKEAKKQASEESAKVIADAKEAAKQAMAKERQAFETMMAAQKEQLAKSFAQSVVQASEQVLRGSLTDTEIKKITDKQISQLKNIKFA